MSTGSIKLSLIHLLWTRKNQQNVRKLFLYIYCTQQICFRMLSPTKYVPGTWYSTGNLWDLCTVQQHCCPPQKYQNVAFQCSPRRSNRSIVTFPLLPMSPFRATQKSFNLSFFDLFIIILIKAATVFNVGFFTKGMYYKLNHILSATCSRYIIYCSTLISSNRAYIYIFKCCEIGCN